MNSTELRSGNLILWNGSPYRVTALDIAKLETYPGENVKAEGIALTEAWLLRAGFRNDGEGYYYLKFENKDGLYDSDRLYISFQDYPKNKLLSHGIDFGSNLLFTPYQQIHQLQNLYFALTGQELPIKQD